VRHAAGRLDELLFGPVRTLIGDRPLLVVPTGEMEPIIAHCEEQIANHAPKDMSGADISDPDQGVVRGSLKLVTHRRGLR
jgi:hypothetical protein